MIKKCACDGKLHYESVAHKVVLICSDCGRHYNLGYHYNESETSLPLDLIDRRILNKVLSQSRCTSNELLESFTPTNPREVPPSYSTILRKMQRLARHGYIIAERKKNRRFVYYATEKLESLNNL